MSGGYLFTELGFRDGFRGGFQGGFGVRIFESPHARESKTVLDSGFHAVDFRIPGTGFLIFFLLELGFRVPVVGGIPDSKDQDFVFHERICSGFRIPQAKLSILTWGDSSNTHHASEVKALCITAHCCTLQFRYRCHLCGCGRLRVYETLPINK